MLTRQERLDVDREESGFHFDKLMSRRNSSIIRLGAMAFFLIYYSGSYP
jgi:hypothetical protein